MKLKIILSSLLSFKLAIAQFEFPNFTGADNLLIVGDSSSRNSNVIRLMSMQPNQAGRAFFQDALTLNDQSFSTFFQFVMNEATSGGDGFAFIILPEASEDSITNIEAPGGLGYNGLGSSLGIEFDTFFNSEIQTGSGNNEPNGNHVGINANFSFPQSSTLTRIEPESFSNGEVWSCWIDYNGVSNNLEIRWNQTGIRPASAGLALNISFPITSEEFFVGFIAGSGDLPLIPEILSWSFRNEFEPFGNVPTPHITSIQVTKDWAEFTVANTLNGVLYQFYGSEDLENLDLLAVTGSSFTGSGGERSVQVRREAETQTSFFYQVGPEQ